MAASTNVANVKKVLCELGAPVHTWQIGVKGITTG